MVNEPFKGPIEGPVSDLVICPVTGLVNVLSWAQVAGPVACQSIAQSHVSQRSLFRPIEGSRLRLRPTRFSGSGLFKRSARLRPESYRCEQEAASKTERRLGIRKLIGKLDNSAIDGGCASISRREFVLQGLYMYVCI